MVEAAKIETRHHQKLEICVRWSETHCSNNFCAYFNLVDREIKALEFTIRETTRFGANGRF
jgi:hypothetical protein